MNGDIAMKEETIDGISKWEVESAAETLRKAQEIADKPKLLRAARKQLRKTKKSTDKALTWADNL